MHIRNVDNTISSLLLGSRSFYYRKYQVPSKKIFRVLSLDGGGSKGAYTLGVLKEAERFFGGAPLANSFDLIYGTSVGSFIAAFLALGARVSEVERLYFEMIPTVMVRTRRSRTAALRKKVFETFGDADFTAFKTNIGLVSTNYDLERPMVFKNFTWKTHAPNRAYKPGFGCTIADAVLASSAAYPLFDMHTVRTDTHGEHLLFDGSYVGNNPTLFAIVDARHLFDKASEEVAVLSVGCGVYPISMRTFFKELYFSRLSGQHLSKMFNISSRTIEQLQSVLFSEIPCVRISDSYEQREYATHVLERDTVRLQKLVELGEASFRSHATRVQNILM